MFCYNIKCKEQKFIEEIDKIENQLQLFGMEIIYQVSIRNKISEVSFVVSRNRLFRI